MRRLARVAAATGVVLVSVAGAGLAGLAVPAQSVVPSTSYTRTETIARTHLVDDADVVADKRTVTVSVATTRDLRDRQAVTVTWKGAHPTGGLVYDQNSAAAAQQEYPVVVMQCRGVDSTAVPQGKRMRPETCWTLTPDERFQYSPSGFGYPAYRMDRYAPTDQRGTAVGQPNPLPSACPDVSVPRWVPFVAADGTVYPGGRLGCAGLAPEAANSADSLQPGSTTYGVADAKGNGSTKFVMQSDESNASLGCSATVACSLVVVPIMGVSCDAAGDAPGAGLPAADRPDHGLVPTVYRQCSGTGAFKAGDFNTSGQVADLPVTGALWWSASNWRNRISVPLTFAPSASVCNVVSNSATALVYGSEAMTQATQQWAPAFCLDPKLYTLQHIQTSEPQAKNLLATASIEAAFQAGPPATPFPVPTVQAPAALSGFAVAYSIDGQDGSPYGKLRLDARLIAKLLSESYRSCAGDCLDFTSKAARKSRFALIANNPIDITRDPEFQALNPGILPTNYLQSAATIEVMSSDSDLMTALTSYLNADPEARAWLNGQPDPWGMVVNPAYEDITLPVSNWPLLDTHIADTHGANQCLVADPAPWLPLVAGPVSNPATVALHLQFDIANSQVNCLNNGTPTQKLAAIGREAPGQRFVIGLVSLADAARYQLNTAALQTTRTATGKDAFDDASGRSFAAPTDAGLRAAAALLHPDQTLGTWTVPYPALAGPTGKTAYPGTVLISIDVPTKGLPRADAKRLAQLLTFAAGRGQVAGLKSGDLPPGYLPLTAANGLGSLSAYTRHAAAAVAAQAGALPRLDGSSTTTRTTPTAPPAATPSHPAGGVPAVGAPKPTPTTVAPNGKPVAAPASSAPVAPPRLAKAADTKSLTSGPLGLALPVIALLALLALGLSAWSSGIGRRR